MVCQNTLIKNFLQTNMVIEFTKTFSPNFKGNPKEIISLIINFDTQGKSFDERDRNSLKLFNIGDETINVKSFKVPHLINKIAYKFFRSSKAERSFTYAHKLLENGILTPTPIAYFEEETILFGHSYYVSKHLKYDLTYRELTTEGIYKGNKEILAAFAKFTYTLHNKGIHFLDHSPGNTLITKEGEMYHFSLVDLNRMKFYDIPYEDRLKNFERLSPKKWMYEIMGKEYARISGQDVEYTIETMWKHTQDFQEAFHKKKRLKKKLKGIFNK